MILADAGSTPLRNEVRPLPPLSVARLGPGAPLRLENQRPCRAMTLVALGIPGHRLPQAIGAGRRSVDSNSGAVFSCGL